MCSDVLAECHVLSSSHSVFSYGHGFLCFMLPALAGQGGLGVSDALLPLSKQVVS